MSTLHEALSASAVNEAVYDNDAQGAHVLVMGHCCALHDYSMTVINLTLPHDSYHPDTTFHENEQSLLARMERLSIPSERGWSPVGEVVRIGS